MISLKILMKAVPSLFEHSDKNVRAEVSYVKGSQIRGSERVCVEGFERVRVEGFQACPCGEVPSVCGGVPSGVSVEGFLAGLCGSIIFAWSGFE